MGFMHVLHLSPEFSRLFPRVCNFFFIENVCKPTVTCCKEIAKKLFEHFLWTYYMEQRCADAHILAPASASLLSKFQDFTGPNSFSRCWKFYTQFQDFPRDVGTLYKGQHAYDEMANTQCTSSKQSEQASNIMHATTRYHPSDTICPHSLRPLLVAIWPCYHQCVRLPALGFLLAFCSNHRQKMHHF